MMSPSPTLVFIYGTLKRGGVNHPVIANQAFVGEARTVPGFALYDLGEYPGMLPTPTDRDGVAGEVWSVEPEALARLDAFEGIAENLYRRHSVPLLAPFDTDKVDAYFYARSIQNRPPVAGGRWPAAGQASSQ